MAYDPSTLDWIFSRTRGLCHICGHRMTRDAYGRIGRTGAWEVEHSRARARGGTDRRNNVYAAHIPCNRRKGAATSKTARAWHGRKRAPLSRHARQLKRDENTTGGAVVGGLIGSAFGPVGAVAGAAIGGWLGSNEDPEGGNRTKTRRRRNPTKRRRPR